MSETDATRNREPYLSDDEIFAGLGGTVLAYELQISPNESTQTDLAPDTNLTRRHRAFAQKFEPGLAMYLDADAAFDEFEASLMGDAAQAWFKCGLKPQVPQVPISKMFQDRPHDKICLEPISLPYKRFQSQSNKNVFLTRGLETATRFFGSGIGLSRMIGFFIETTDTATSQKMLSEVYYAPANVSHRHELFRAVRRVQVLNS